jgi:uncharacterized membrane protein HdeD (DUF308 family)
MFGGTHSRSGWLTIEGIVLLILGAFALVLPEIAGLTAALIFGWILILAGITGLASAFGAAGHAHRGWSLASGLIALLVGLLLVFDPIGGASGLALLIGLYLFVDGFLLIGLSLDQRRRRPDNWGWLLASGIADLVLAGFIVFLNPLGSAVLIGIIIGIDLIFAGVTLLLMQRLNSAIA